METFVGDTIRISLLTNIDLSGYATLQIKFRRPNRTIGKWSATIDPTDDMIMYYDTDEDDLNLAGKWSLQANAKNNPTNKDLHGAWVPLDVLTPYGDTTTPPTTLEPTTVAPTTV